MFDFDWLESLEIIANETTWGTSSWNKSTKVKHLDCLLVLNELPYLCNK